MVKIRFSSPVCSRLSHPACICPKSLFVTGTLRFYHGMTINPRSFISDQFSMNPVLPEEVLSRRVSGVSFKKPIHAFSPRVLKRLRRNDSHHLPSVVGVMGGWVVD